jgi:anaerobic selenocysteine-containing dehydrogenase
MAALPVSPVAYPAHQFDSPSGKVEFWSERCSDLGLPPLPEYQEPMETPRSQPALARAYPLVLRPGRTINQFHSFYDESQAVPTLARANGEPEVWIHPDDAGARGLQDGDWMTVFNERGDFQAQAKVTSDVVPGVLWMRSGWFGVNRVTNGSRALSDSTADSLLGAVPFAVGQSAYEALVEVAKKASPPG